MIEEKDIDNKDSAAHIQAEEKKVSYLRPEGKRHPVLCRMLKNYSHIIFVSGKLSIDEYISKFFRVSSRRKDHLVIKTLKLVSEKDS